MHIKLQLRHSMQMPPPGGEGVMEVGRDCMGHDFRCYRKFAPIPNCRFRDSIVNLCNAEGNIEFATVLMVLAALGLRFAVRTA